MVSKTDRKLERARRHARVRNKVSGTAERPRLCVYRSNTNLYAQIIDDVAGNTLVAASTLDKEIKTKKSNVEAAKEVCRQLKLRDIGGIIIIDYIDMKKQENKDKIEKLLKQELKNDRAKTQVEGFTKLDLMELTRKHICSHKD